MTETPICDSVKLHCGKVYAAGFRITSSHTDLMFDYSSLRACDCFQNTINADSVQ